MHWGFGGRGMFLTQLKLNRMTKIAEYDVAEYIQQQIDYFQEDKQEFLVSKLWDEERNPESVTDKEISDYFCSVNSEEYQYHWEDFNEDMDEEFRKYIGKEVYVEGRNMGWRNRSGEKTFTLNDTIDMFREIAPECDLTYSMEKVKDREYEVRIAHHDSPMGEMYNIKIK